MRTGCTLVSHSFLLLWPQRALASMLLVLRSIRVSHGRDALRERTQNVSPEARAFLADLAFSSTEKSGRADASRIHASLFESSTWTLTATTADELRSQLQHRLIALSLRATDLHAAMLLGEKRLTLRVFDMAMRKMGYTGTSETLQDIFGIIETDGSDVIGVAELHVWLSAKSSQVTLSLRGNQRGPSPWPLPAHWRFACACYAVAGFYGPRAARALCSLAPGPRRWQASAERHPGGRRARRRSRTNGAT